MTDKKLACLSCGVFSREIEILAGQEKLEGSRIVLDSMLHMNPAGLEQAISRDLESKPHDNYVLLYGDCCPHMNEFQNRANVSKVAGINCCEILLGKEMYRHLQKEKTFIFLPEWTVRWREIFTRELGFKDPEIAQSFMKEYCSRLVYIDTGIVPAPEKIISEISVYFDMPMDVISISLDILMQGINKAIQKFKEDDHHGK
jgi:hypothetical protein